MMAALSTFFCDHLCIVWSYSGLSLWNPDGKSTNREHTYVFVLVQMTVYYMHHVLFLHVGPVFFLHVVENIILSKVNATGQ